jgi:hypothetical protein
MNHKGMGIASLMLATGIIVYASVHYKNTEGEQQAHQYCGSCHKFPEPSLLDKDSWTKSVIPRMAFRMGIKTKITFELQDLKLIESLVPKQPMISNEDLELIKRFYEREAPPSLLSKQTSIRDTLYKFIAQPIKHFKNHRVTLLKYDAKNEMLYIGDAFYWLYMLDKNLNILDSIKLKSPATCLASTDSGLMVSLLGDLMPSDRPNGQLVSIDKSKKITTVLDSLKRPDFFTLADINGDAKDDLILCSFGNFTGSLEIYKNGSINKITLSTSPGVRKAVVIDWDKDGKKDIVALMAQGDERLMLYRNLGDYNFDSQVLYRFPPVFGSCYFELADVNNDNLDDIIYTNGDNADYTKITKPYHSIKIFQHQKLHDIKEIWSYAMPGAYQTCTEDFDKDGDLDIAAISLFPDTEHHPEQSFVYFENINKNEFKPQVEPATYKGEWMVMETFDADNDGDVDIVVAPFSFEDFGSKKVAKKPEMLLLKNNKIPAKG